MYHISTNSFSNLPSMLCPRDAFGIAVAMCAVYIFGGFNGVGRPNRAIDKLSLRAGAVWDNAVQDCGVDLWFTSAIRHGWEQII